MKLLVYLFLLLSYNTVFSSSMNSDNEYLKLNENDMVLGNVNAPVTIIEYSSFSCPHCAFFHKKVFAKLDDQYIKTNKLKYIHRDYPLDKAAFYGSVVAHCAGRNKYYVFLKILFEKQENWVFSKNYLEILENIAKLGGMSKKRFNECLSDKSIEESILNSRLIATNQLNVNATPSFFINGKLYTGMHDFEFFSKIIDDILKENKK